MPVVDIKDKETLSGGVNRAGVVIPVLDTDLPKTSDSSRIRQLTGEQLVDGVAEAIGVSEILTDLTSLEQDVLAINTDLGEKEGEITALQAGKVDKVPGKGLSTNDYDATQKAEVAKIANKVDKVTGKGLSTNDYTDTDKANNGKIPVWVAGVYPAGYQCNHQGKDYTANAPVIATDVPGVSGKWSVRLAAYEATSNESENMFDPLTVEELTIGPDFATYFYDPDNSYVSALIPVLPNTKYRVAGLQSTTVKRIAFFSAAQAALKKGVNLTATTQEITTSSDCYFVRFGVKWQNESSDYSNVSFKKVATIATGINGLPLRATEVEEMAKTPTGREVAFKDELIGEADMLDNPNLFDPATVVDLTVLPPRFTTYVNEPDYSKYSDYISVTPNTPYEISGLQSTNRKRVLYFDENKVRLITSGTDPSNYIYATTELSATTQVIVTPEGCYNLQFAVRWGLSESGDFSGVSFKRAENIISGIDGKELLAKFVDENVRTPTGKKVAFVGDDQVEKQAIPITVPPKIYVTCNDLKPLSDATPPRNYCSELYLDHCLVLNTKLYGKWKESGNDRFTFNAPIRFNTATWEYVVNEGQNIYTANKTVTASGDIQDDAKTVQLVSTKASYLGNKTVNYLAIGASNTNGTTTAENGVKQDEPQNTPDHLTNLFEMDRIDAGGVGHIFNTLGILRRYQWNVKYEGQTIPKIAYHEGRGSWGTCDYALYADNRINGYGQGVWDLLGLGDGSGTDFTFSDAQKTLMFTTHEGKFTPKNTPAFISYMNGRYGGITTYEQALAKATDLLNNPRNPFFDKDKVGTYKFSLAKYLERYKTLADDGVTRLVVGSTAGSKVTDINGWNVCKPTHVRFDLGGNDIDGAWRKSAMQGIIADIKSVDANTIIIIGSVDATGSYFLEYYPNYDETFAMANAKHTRGLEINKEWMTLEDAPNKVFYNPTYFIGLTAKGVPFREINDASYLFNADPAQKRYTKFGIDPDAHYNAFAHAAFAYQEYSLINWTRQFMA